MTNSKIVLRFTLIFSLFLSIILYSCNKKEARYPGKSGKGQVKQVSFDSMDIKRSFRKLGILVPKTKKQANNFTLKNLEGQKVSLKDFRGKVVFLNFWATWCGSCRAEMPSMQKLYQTLKDKDFVMLGVAVDQTQDPVEPYVELLEMTFPVVYDSDKEVSSRYRLSATPTTYIIDKDGTILGKVVGESDWASKTSIDLFNKLSSR